MSRDAASRDERRKALKLKGVAPWVFSGVLAEVLFPTPLHNFLVQGRVAISRINMVLFEVALLLSAYLSGTNAFAVSTCTTYLGHAGITSAPQPELRMLRRATQAAELVGFVSYPGNNYESYTCAGGYYTTSGKYGRCCAYYSTCVSTDFNIGCTSTSLVLKPSITGACTFDSYTICQTLSVFNDINDQNPITYIGCNPTGGDLKVYRTPPVNSVPTSGAGAASSTVATTNIPGTSAASSGTPNTNQVGGVVTVTASPTTVSASGTSSPTQTSSSNDNSSSTPTGAIVGGVVGGVAAIAIVGLGFWIWRLKGKKNPPPPDTGAPGATGPPAPPVPPVPQSPGQPPMQQYQQWPQGPVPSQSPPPQGTGPYPQTGAAGVAQTFYDPAKYPQQPPYQDPNHPAYFEMSGQSATQTGAHEMPAMAYK